jgi:hypothetical protein
VKISLRRVSELKTRKLMGVVGIVRKKCVVEG